MVSAVGDEYEIHGLGWPSSRSASHAVRGLSSNADEARRPGTPSKRLEESNDHPGGLPPPSLSMALSRAVGLTVAQPSPEYLRAAGRVTMRFIPGSGSTMSRLF